MHRKKHTTIGLALPLLLVLGPALATIPTARAQQLVPGVLGNAMVLPINSTQVLMMSTKKPIRTVINQKDNVVQVSPIPNRKDAVMITGRDSGTTKIIMTDEDGREESLEVVVQLDVEPLRSAIRRGVKLSNVEPIPSANNMIIVSGTVARAQDVETVMRIAQTYVGTPDRVINNLAVGGVSQVQLDVVVAQVSRTQFRALAFNFLSDTQHSFLNSTVGQAVSQPASIGVGGQISNNGLLIGVPGAPNGGPSNLFFGVLHNNSGFMAFMQALQTEDVTKIKVQTSLVTQSGTLAHLQSGGMQAIPIPAGLGQVGIQFEPFGVQLDFLPIVLGDGRIHLDVNPTVSNLDAAFGTSISGTVVPGQTVQSVHSVVELEDGQTFAVGGLIQKNITGDIQKVPILGDLPFIGAAFSAKAYTETESELIILVTPHLVDGMSCPQMPKLLPGDETRRPDNFELFLEQMLEAPLGPREKFQDHRYVPAHIDPAIISPYPCPEPCTSGACGAAGRCGVNCGQCGGGMVETNRPVTVSYTQDVGHVSTSFVQRPMDTLPVNAVPVMTRPVAGDRSAVPVAMSAESQMDQGRGATTASAVEVRSVRPGRQWQKEVPMPVVVDTVQPSTGAPVLTTGMVETLQDGISLTPAGPETATSAASQDGATFPTAAGSSSMSRTVLVPDSQSGMLSVGSKP